MSVFSRYKRSPQGFRTIVELWESTPPKRRQKMIEVGQQDDPEYAEQILRHMLSWEDILALSDLELAEVIANAPGNITAMAIAPLDEETRIRFLKNAIPQKMAEIRERLEEGKISAWETDGARLKMVERTRELERNGVLRVKVIPVNI